jgi:glycerol-3-phosphate acyltransferase PlsY
VLVLATAYAVGCVATGYYLTRLRTARDIRQIGSGSSGATNVARVLGWQGFVITLAADAAKGALVVLLTRLCALDSWTVWLAVLAAVAGHVWPVHLGFKGGKGVATYLGALVVLDWQAGVILAGLAGVVYLV